MSLNILLSAKSGKIKPLFIKMICSSFNTTFRRFTTVEVIEKW